MKTSRTFALSTRILIQDDVILPRYDANNKPIAYSLEPQFSADTIDDCWNIPWNYASGESRSKLRDRMVRL